MDENKDPRERFINIKEKLKFFLTKYKKIIILVLAIILLLITIVIVVNKNNRFNGNVSYDKIEQVKLEDIENLYKNVSDVSCVGGLYFDLKVGYDTISITKLNNEAILNYMFSYLDKNGLLSDEMSKSFINDTAKDLFYDKKSSLFNDIKNFQYGDYVYNVDGNIVKRNKQQCVSNFTYVSRLFGHTNSDEEISMDVDMGKLVDGVLYDMAGNKLGNYSNDSIKLMELFANAPYYRYNYVKINGIYKLKSVGLISRELPQ